MSFEKAITVTSRISAGLCALRSGRASTSFASTWTRGVGSPSGALFETLLRGSATDAGVTILATLPRSRFVIADSNRDVTERRRSRLEQAALRRIAALFAQGVQPDELFAVVAEEVGRVVDAPAVAVARYESDDTATVCGTFPTRGLLFRTGARVPLEGANVLGLIREHAEPARVDNYAELQGEIADVVRRSGMRSSVGVPIVVGGRLWGAIVTSGTERLSEDTGARLAEFTKLLAAAIANTEARESLAQLADEQAALRRVATLVAQRAPTGELFGALVEEVARLLPVSTAAMGRYDPDGLVTTVAAWSEVEAALPIGRRWVPEGDNVTALVFRTGAAVRIDDFSRVSGPLGERARPVGYRSAVGCPIMVEGRLWGVIATASVAEEPLPSDTEQRLEKFTELVTTAISNSESRAALQRLADEQAALHRVATLVAQGSAPADVFAAVSAEVDRVFGLDTATFDVAVVGRFEPGPELVVVGLSKSVEVVPLGSRWPADELFAPTHVLRTGRSARIRADDLEAPGTEVADFLRQHGYLSQVASPIVVEGRRWGAVSVNSRNELPPDTEERLERFTDLVGTAIANAESHERLARLADEQAALRRVATLVAQDTAPAEIFAAVSAEVDRVFGFDPAAFDVAGVVRFEPGPVLSVVGVSKSVEAVPLGSRFPPDDLFAPAHVLRTGRSARVGAEDLASIGGEVADFLRHHGYLSQVASPIVVEGRLWGAISVNSSNDFPPDTEDRLESFTELVATAIANTQSREALGALADEQAALRRVATLVARDAPPGEVFDAVAMEVGKLLDTDITVVGRYDGDGAATAIGSWSASPGGVPVGTRSVLGGRNVLTLVAETERPARVDGYDDASGGAAEIARRHGWRSSIAAPIIVEGRLWGVMLVATQRPEPFPAGAEERLAAFTDLVATAIANAESKSELAASRRRIVAAGDEARRRIERDLHDGIQQRLIALGFRARAMTRKPSDELPAIAAELAEGLKDVSDELREVSRGIHPTILTEAGLGPALRALARRSNVPIEVDVRLDERLPAPVEAAAYYIASEALTNVAKHAHADVVELIAAHDDRVLTLEVRDDGIGGVDAGRGSGILGLTDRVEALGGTISIASPPRGGTTLTVQLPITM
jgi:GAF domain-containing protein